MPASILSSTSSRGSRGTRKPRSPSPTSMYVSFDLGPVKQPRPLVKVEKKPKQPKTPVKTKPEKQPRLSTPTFTRQASVSQPSSIDSNGSVGKRRHPSLSLAPLFGLKRGLRGSKSSSDVIEIRSEEEQQRTFSPPLPPIPSSAASSVPPPPPPPPPLSSSSCDHDEHEHDHDQQSILSSPTATTSSELDGVIEEPRHPPLSPSRKAMETLGMEDEKLDGDELLSHNRPESIITIPPMEFAPPSPPQALKRKSLPSVPEPNPERLPSPLTSVSSSPVITSPPALETASPPNPTFTPQPRVQHVRSSSRVDDDLPPFLHTVERHVTPRRPHTSAGIGEKSKSNNVIRQEAVWIGEWNQKDMQEVITKLRNLR